MSSIYKCVDISKDTQEVEIYEAYWHLDSGLTFPVVRVEVPTIMPTQVVRDVLAEILLSIPDR